jgi:DNA-binding MarR family transcriptional regulator
LQIEEQSLKNCLFLELSVTGIHTIKAIGMYSERTMSGVAQKLKITVSTTTAINKKGICRKKKDLRR